MVVYTLYSSTICVGLIQRQFGVSLQRNGGGREGGIWILDRQPKVNQRFESESQRYYRTIQKKNDPNSKRKKKTNHVLSRAPFRDPRDHTCSRTRLPGSKCDTDVGYTDDCFRKRVCVRLIFKQNGTCQMCVPNWSVYQYI